MNQKKLSERTVNNCQTKNKKEFAMNEIKLTESFGSALFLSFFFFFSYFTSVAHKYFKYSLKLLNSYSLFPFHCPGG